MKLPLLCLLAFSMVSVGAVSFSNRVCYMPTTFTVKHDIHSTAFVKTQTECEDLCTAADECTAIVTQQKSGELWCVLLGAEAPVNCAPPTAVFFKSLCSSFG